MTPGWLHVEHSNVIIHRPNGDLIINWSGMDCGMVGWHLKRSVLKYWRFSHWLDLLCEPSVTVAYWMDSRNSSAQAILKWEIWNWVFNWNVASSFIVVDNYSRNRYLWSIIMGSCIWGTGGSSPIGKCTKDKLVPTTDVFDLMKEWFFLPFQWDRYFNVMIILFKFVWVS